MADSDYMNRGERTQTEKRNDSVFSWSDEYQAYTQRTGEQNSSSEKGAKYRPEDSVFSNNTFRSSGSYSANRYDYRYEYPYQDYKYTPKTNYGDRYNHASDYERTSQSDPRQKTPSNRNVSGKGTDRTSQGKKAQPKNNKAPKTSAGKKNPPQKGKNPPAQKSGGKATRNAKNERPPVKKNPPKPSEAQKKKAQKKASRDNREIEKTNQRYEGYKDKGMSSGETKSRRREEKKRRKKLNNMVIVGIVIFAVLIGIAAFGVFYGLPIKTINVEGEKTYSKAEIEAASGVSQGDNLLILSEKKLNEKIGVALPYIDTVKVKRVVPDKLVLIVTETKDKLLFSTSKGYMCTDKNGKVTSEKKQAAKDGKIKVEGLVAQKYEIGRMFKPNEKNGNKKKFELVMEIVSELEKAGIKNCHAINIENEDKIELSCGKLMKIYVNADINLEDKLSMLSQQIKSGTITSNVAHYYDLRFSGQIVFNEGKIS